MSGNQPPINVLVLGPSQNGKSTFIKKLCSVAGAIGQKEPEVGQGTFACTTDPDIYDLTLSKTSYKLVDELTQEDIDIPEDEKKILQPEVWKRKGARVEAIDPEAPTVRLRLIDTPGLDDNRGKDAENAQKVLHKLNELSKSSDSSYQYISAIFLVIKSGVPFSNTFQEIYHYYRKCMPNLFGGLTVLNTNFTLLAWQKEVEKMADKGRLSLRTSQPARLKYMEDRRMAFAEKFHSDPLHFFINSKPTERFPFEQYTTLNEISRIINFASAQGPMPITDMNFCKIPLWLSIDAVLIGYLKSTKDHWEAQQHRMLTRASKDVRDRAELNKQNDRWKAAIREIDEELRTLDTDTEYKLNSYTTEDIGFGSRAWKIVSLSKVQQTLTFSEKDVPEFEVTALDTSDATWIMKRLDRVNKTWTGKYRANYNSFPVLTARSWAKSRIYHAARIKKLKDSKAGFEDDLDSNRIMQQSLESINTNDGKEAQIQQYRSFISKSEEFISMLSKDTIPLDSGLNKAAMKRYGLKSIAQVDPDDLYQLARSEDKDFEAALRLLPVVFPRIGHDDPRETCPKSEDNDEESEEEERHGRTEREEKIETIPENQRTRHQAISQSYRDHHTVKTYVDQMRYGVKPVSKQTSDQNPAVKDNPQEQDSCCCILM